MNAIQFRTPGTIISQPGGIGQLAEDFALRSAKRVLIVTDSTLVGLGFAERATEALRQRGADALIYDEVEPEPSAETVRGAAAFGRDSGVDSVIGLGGGSPMDVAKLVALLVASPQPIEEMYGVDLAQGDRVPLEVTKVAVVTADSGDKAPILAPQLYCDTVILDVELTLGLPPKVTASTGVDAMVHAIEGFTSGLRKNPAADQMALQAMRLLYPNVCNAVENGQDVEARSAMLVGSMLAGYAFANATVGAVHALAYPLGTQFHVSHGGSNAAVLVPVMRFNMPEATPLYAELARAVVSGLEGRSDQDAADLLADSLEALIPEVGLEGRLREFGIEDDHVGDLVDGALRQERLLSYNIKVPERSDIEAIYRGAL
jgi:alcohol dehydrogenase class IV